MKGLLLAGGTGTRLHPMTAAVCKQLLPVYDKPMVYYPLSTLMLAGIREILLISTPGDRPRFEALFGDGSHLGLAIDYAVQPRPEGLAQAFRIGRSFVGEHEVGLVLGDNLFYGGDLGRALVRSVRENRGATIFLHRVRDPGRYGVARLGPDGEVVALEEKPERPTSNLAVTGLYLYDNAVLDIARDLRPSARGELEITDVNRVYLREGRLKATLLGRGNAWLDTGTPESLLEAAHFVRVVERRQGLKIACVEEVAWRKGFVDDEAFARLAASAAESAYGDYLRGLVASELAG